MSQSYAAYQGAERARRDEEARALIAACGLVRGDWVCRKGQPCGPTGIVEELHATREHVDNRTREYTTRVRVKAYVRWIAAQTGGTRLGGQGHHSTLLCSRLETCRPATPAQIVEIGERARALGYSGVADVEYVTYERAERRLEDYRAGRVGKRTSYCPLCNQSHVYDEPRPCRATGYALYNTTGSQWAVYDLGTGRAIAPNARTPAIALAVGERLGVTAARVFISAYMRQRGAIHGQEIAHDDTL